MDKHKIDETIYKIIESSKINKEDLWDKIFNNESIPDFFIEETIKTLDCKLKERHIKYIEIKIAHIIESCIDDVENM